MTETQNEQNVQTFGQTSGTNPISMEQNVQASTSDLSSVNLSTNTSEIQIQSECNIQTENLNQTCINIPVEKNQSPKKQKNKFAIFGLISDILGLFFIMVSMFFVRVGGSGILLLIGFSLFFVGFILGIIGSRREPKVHFPIFIFIIIPIWFIIMFSINYFINNISLTNNIIRRGWFGSFGLGIILGIIELYKIYRSFRIFIIIPFGLCCFVFLFFVGIFYLI